MPRPAAPGALLPLLFYHRLQVNSIGSNRAVDIRPCLRSRGRIEFPPQARECLRYPTTRRGQSQQQDRTTKQKPPSSTATSVSRCRTQSPERMQKQNPKAPAISTETARIAVSAASATRDYSPETSSTMQRHPEQTEATTNPQIPHAFSLQKSR